MTTQQVLYLSFIIALTGTVNAIAIGTVAQAIDRVDVCEEVLP